MRILFCNIAWMDYYQGIILGKDEPRSGGAYVQETHDAHEKYNFQSVHLTQDETGYPDREYCLGFVETKSTNGQTVNRLNIEKIDGCAALKKEPEASDVLVVYCAKYGTRRSLEEMSLTCRKISNWFNGDSGFWSVPCHHTLAEH